MSFQYGRSMRKLLSSAYSTTTDEPHSVTKYQPILINTQLEAPSRHGNRIGSPANQFYYYDSSTGNKGGNENSNSSAAALVYGNKMNEVNEEEINMLLEEEGEMNMTVETIIDDLNGDGDDGITKTKETIDIKDSTTTRKC